MSEDLERRIGEIEEQIHKLHVYKLVSMNSYIKHLTELAEGEAGVRKKLEEKGLDKDEVKRLGELAKTYLTEKNIIREIRYAIGLVKQEEQRLRDMKAELTAMKMRR